jgi:hypothetical protein
MVEWLKPRPISKPRTGANVGLGRAHARACADACARSVAPEYRHPPWYFRKQHIFQCHTLSRGRAPPICPEGRLVAPRVILNLSVLFTYEAAHNLAATRKVSCPPPSKSEKCEIAEGHHSGRRHRPVPSRGAGNRPPHDLSRGAFRNLSRGAFRT